MTDERKKRKEYCEQCVHIASFVLLGLAKRISEENEGQEIDQRLFLLVGSAARCVNTAAAIRRLWADRPFSEEMGMLLRPLVETVVNAAYLQFAPVSEVEGFIAFDTISLSKTIKLAEEVVPAGSPRVMGQSREAFEELAEDKRQEFEGIYSSTNWTKLDLHSRAVFVDAKTGLSICAFLSRTAYRHGHTYIHATFRSMERTLDTLRTGAYDAEATEAEAEHNLFAAAQTMQGFAILCHTITEGNDFDSALAECNRLLKCYSDSVASEARNQDLPVAGGPPTA